jgi:tRNA threonylcarbamoyl adenosine modification protein YeaZ
MSNQPILAFDCACVGGSVALMGGGHTRHHDLDQTKEAAQLVPAIDKLMKTAGIHYGKLGAIITTIGPGSFTGVRIGLATLHGLGLAHPTPIKTLSTLQAMAWAVALSADAPGAFYIALRAGKDELYAQRFHLANGTPAEVDEITLTPENFAAWGAPCFGNHLPTDSANYLHGPNAAMLCAIAEQLPLTKLANALPLYIRRPDAIAPAPYAWLTAN